MEFDIETSPFQKITQTNATVVVDAQPASIPIICSIERVCENIPMVYEAYRYYLPEQDFTNETYFNAIAQMLTVRDVEDNADLVLLF